MKKVFFILLVLSVFFLTPVYADSGWDSSYDSGYSGGDYFDSGSSSDYDSYGGGSGGISFRGFRIPSFTGVIIAAVVAISTMRKKKKKSGGFIPDDNNKAEDVIISRGMERDHESVELLDSNYDMIIQKYLPDSSEEKLLEEFYHIYLEVQKAWMDFDYVSLEKYCSNTLFESYRSDLEALKEKHGKNIMSDFQLKNSAIREIEEKEHQVVVDAFLAVSLKDYVINEDTGEVIRGDKETVITNSYDLEFIMDLDGVENCPSCGAKLTSRVCDSCGTTVDKKKDTFVLNQKGIMGK